MRQFALAFILIALSFASKAQTCDKIMEDVKSGSNGKTYISHNSDLISKVTFYDVRIDYQSSYFVIVCFKQEYSNGCNEYIYEVGLTTKKSYVVNYKSNARKAFRDYIEPYSDNLCCAPDFD
jgi:hypothetical protein